MTDSRDPAEVMFSTAVRAQQERLGSRRLYARHEAEGRLRQEITEDLKAFLAERDSAYLATAGADGQPYIQHRGGPKGFLKPLGPRRIGFADFAGNRQYITLGNISENPKAFLFLMDYTNRARIKIWGRLQAVEDQPGLVERLAMPGYPGKVERVLLFDVDAWDINCKQHIPVHYDEETVTRVVEKLTGEIDALKAEVERLKAANS